MAHAAEGHAGPEVADSVVSLQIFYPLDALVRRDEIGGRLRLRFKAGRSYRARPSPMVQVPVNLVPSGDRPAVTADVAAPGQGVPRVFPSFLLILGQVYEAEEGASVKIVGLAGGGATFGVHVEQGQVIRFRSRKGGEDGQVPVHGHVDAGGGT